MRRKVGLLLIGLGAFLIALAPLARFYVVHQVLAAPRDIYEKSTLRAVNATYLDTTTFKIKQGATLTATNTTRGDVHAGDNKIAVWDQFTSIEDLDANVKVDTQTQRAVFDRRTGMLQNGRGAQVNGDSNVRQTGVGPFWPVHTKPKTYQYFDTTTKRAWPITFAGNDRTQGIKTYRFVQKIPPTVTDTIKPGVPASLLGLKPEQLSQVPGYDKKTKLVAVDRVYQATATVWVDPHTGAPVNQEQKVLTTLRTSDGVDRLVVGNLDLKMLPASQKHLVHKSDGNWTYVTIVKNWLPYGGGAAGVVLVVVGLFLTVTGRRRPAHRSGTADTARPSGDRPPTAEPA